MAEHAVERVDDAAGRVRPDRGAADDVPTDTAAAGDTAAPAAAGQPGRRTRPNRRNEAAYDDRDDPELAAYNHYLAWFNAHPHATAADYPGYPDMPTNTDMTTKETR